MSWFYFGDIQPKNAAGVYLRIGTLPDEVRFAITVGPTEVIDHIEVIEATENVVHLEFWVKDLSTFSSVNPDYRVCIRPFAPNPRWACEAEAGRGSGKRR